MFDGPNNRIGETCAGCGKEIGMLEGSYYRKGPNDDIGKSFHTFCGDSFGIAAKVAAEREACARLVETYLGATTESKRFGIEAAKAIRALSPVAESGCISFPRWWIQHLYTGLNRINTANVPGEADDFIFTLRHQLLDKLNETAPPHIC